MKVAIIYLGKKCKIRERYKLYKTKFNVKCNSVNTIVMILREKIIIHIFNKQQFSKKIKFFYLC